MRSPPPLSKGVQYPLSAGLSLVAIGVSAFCWIQKDVDFFAIDPRFEEGEVWRLFTSTLPHAGLLHLAFNCYWIWVFGTLIEEKFGFLRAVLLALVLAAGSGGAEYAFMSGGIGLSGIGYGYFGFLAVLSKRDRRFALAVDERTSQLFVAWFFLCILLTKAEIMAVANVAHGAGGLLGACIGRAVSSEGRERLKFGGLAAVAVMLAVALAAFGREQVNQDRVRSAQQLGYLAYRALVDHDYDRAVGYLDRAVRFDPQNSDNWQNLAYAYWKMGNIEKSAEAGQKAAAVRSKPGK